MKALPAQCVTLKDGREVMIREAVSDDAAAVLAYMKALLPETESLVSEPDEFDMDEKQEQQWLQAQQEDTGAVVLIACDGEEVIGIINAKSGKRRRIRHRADLGMSVRAACRGLGLGTALLQGLIDWAEAHATVEKLCLHVFHNNEPALALYRKFDFVEVGRCPRHTKLGGETYLNDVMMYRFV